jgi:hypothetical protein
MAIIRNLNHLVSVVLDSFKQLGRGRAWLALLIYTMILTIALLAHYQHLSPIFYGPVRSLTSLIDSDLSERFYHYPSHFLFLPWFFGWAKLILGVLLEGIFLGTAALVFWQSYSRTKIEGSLFKRALSLWPQFILVSILFNGLITAASFFLPQILQEYLGGSPRRQLALELGVLPFIYTLLLALFYVAIPAVAIYRESFVKAIGRSLRQFVRRPFSMLTMGLLVLLFPILFSALASHPDFIIDKFRPELVFWVLMVGLVVEMIANFFWMSTAVRFLADEES